MRPVLFFLSLLLACATAGCLERRVLITSDPPGALVYANDVELGRTPLEANFTYYGAYDVRVELEGYEPLRTKARADVPLYEVPPVDLVAMAMPFDIEKTVRWHFGLLPAMEKTTDPLQLESDLVARAKELRGQLAEPGKPAPPSPSAAEAPVNTTPPAPAVPTSEAPAPRGH